jgi:cytochrome P450
VWLKPRGLDKILDMISPKNMKDYHAFIERSVRRRISQDEKNIGSNTGPIREDMFHFICSARDPKTGQPVFTTADLISEGSVLTVAGSDTTATTICSLVFYLVHNTAIYDKLVTEIRSTFSSYQEIVHGPKLKGCAYLRACINEALRMTPPLPSELPRIVLKGGETIAGEYYPAGTIVGTSEWANGRNGDIYGDPYVFRPERWVISDENPRTEVNRIKNCLNPFSKGPANCIGQNLAMWELHLVIARTLWRLDIRAAPGATLGGGQPSVGLEKGNPLQYQVADAYVALRKGPMVQFKGRGGTLV